MKGGPVVRGILNKTIGQTIKKDLNSKVCLWM